MGEPEPNARDVSASDPSATSALDEAFLAAYRSAPESARWRILSEFVCRTAYEFLPAKPDGPVRPEDHFLDLGFDSLLAVDFKLLLETRLGCPLQSTVLFDCPTPSALVDRLARVLGDGTSSASQHDAARAPDRRRHVESTAPELDLLDRDALLSLAKRQSSRLRTLEEARTEPIAIVGIGCRFPGQAYGPQRFWRMLEDGVDAISEVPPDRWDVERFYDANPATRGRTYSRWGGFIEDVDRFDARLFGISPREAVQLDPQQRVILEVVWEALEEGGLSPADLQDSHTGVFIGTRGSEYFPANGRTDPEDAETYFATGNSLSTLAGRLSYFFGFSGPCFALDTACSSSLVAVHVAVQSLRRGECSAAIAGGVNLILDPFGTIALSKASLLSPDGRCKTFDARGNGYVRSEGAGAVVLKRLSRAIADGDHIHALIRGSAINQDGASGGLTVPNGAAQSAVVRQALADAGLAPNDIDYIETHGTGTALGDPIEVAALDAVFARDRDRPLVVGSIKTNIGHGECVAGIAGFIKVALALENEAIPKNLHLEQRNPHIPWDTTVVLVPLATRSWARGVLPRRAGVSSFGFSGTNAHVILEEAPALAARVDAERSALAPRPLEIVCVSGHLGGALDRQVGRLAEAFGREPALDVHDAAYTLGTGRTHLALRRAFVVKDRAQLAAMLTASAASEGREGTSAAGRAASQPLRIAFLYTGQGSQHAGMGRELFALEPVFREALERCASVMDALLPAPLLSILWGDHMELLGRTDCTQPAIFAIEHAFTELWGSIGIRPTWVLGHSVGEFAAAVTAGVLSLDDACRLVCARGRLMVERTRPGSMAAIQADPQVLQPFLEEHAGKLSIAAWNGPERVVLSGDHDAMRSVTTALGARGVRCDALDVSHAFHSSLMEPMLGAFEETVRSAHFARPSVGFVSTCRPGRADEVLTEPSYWVNHVREPVRFLAGMQALEKEGVDVLLEVGPAPVLLGMARRFVKSEVAWLASMRPLQGEFERFATSLADLHVRGAPIRWNAYYRGREGRKLALPAYAFERDRFWLERREAPSAQPGARDGHPLLGSRHVSAAMTPGRSSFGTVLTAKSPDFLSHHEVFGRVVVPAAALFDQALAAARATFGATPIEVRDVAVSTPLVLDEPRRVETVIHGDDSADIQAVRAFELHSCAADDAEDPTFTLHAKGVLARTESAAVPLHGDLAALRVLCADTLDRDEFYTRFDEIGLGFGTAFQSIRALTVGPEDVLARVELSDGLIGDIDPWMLHPALLDGSFQCTRILALRQGIDDLFLPIGVERITLIAPAGRSVWCHARMRPVQGEARALLVDLDLYHEDGQLIAAVRGLEGMRTTRAALLAHGDPLKGVGHVVAWVERPHALAPVPATPSNRVWRIVGARDGLGEALRTALEAAGANVEHDTSGDFGPIGASATSAEIGVVYVADRGIDPDATSDADPLERQRSMLGGALDLVKALQASGQRGIQLALVARGTMSAGESEVVDPAAATLLGLGATIALEQPDWRVQRIDLDPDASDVDSAAHLARELLEPDAETTVAWRGERRHAARLLPRLSAATGALLDPPSSPTYRLGLRDFGGLEKLALLPHPRRAPAADEVEIRVHAASINFKDVLGALGLLRSIGGPERAADQPLGLECAGTVVAVGSSVRDFAVGDEVIAASPGSMATHVTVMRSAVAKKPRGLDFAAAAGLPTVYLTAMFALERFGRLKKGERVLIHAAAGGVGQAAVRMALAIGAEIFATASPSKWAHLRAQGVQHVMHSRTLDFEAEILRATGGRGVDLVVNSLVGAAIPASLRALRKGGRFVEIGKLDAWTPERVAADRPDVDYHIVDLSAQFEPNAPLLAEMSLELVRRVESGEIAPVPTRTFPLEQAVSAFRFVSRSRHIGKVCLSFPDAARAEASKGAEHATLAATAGVHVVTGGLGALGLRVAAWLVDCGARDVCLISRRTPNEAQIATIRAWEARGARVRLAAVDVADRGALADLFRGFDAPLVGIVHAAGTLDDGVLANQTWERFRGVLAPKVRGASNLHALTLDRDLAYFVCFSSMAAMLGAAGQGPYVAANAFLDALCQRRRALGLPAISIAWGPWAGGGMASDIDERNRARFAAVGLGAILPEQGVAILTRLIDDPRAPAQVGVLPVTWARFLKQFGRNVPLFYEALAKRTDDSAVREDPTLLAFQNADDAARRPALIAYLSKQLAAVMGYASAADVDTRRVFIAMGVDSLIAVDLRNRLESDLKRALPVTLVFDHPTIEAIADHLLGCRGDETVADEALLAEVEALSDAEAERLLDAGRAHG
jgi:acyl transferase domain-containing protein/acyl carrier protein